MTDPRDPYGRLVHEQRLAHEADRASAEGRQRFNLGAWEDRTEDQRELDRRIAAAVAAAAVAAERARLAEVRQVAVDFCRHHVVLNPQAEALWHAVLQVIDRDKNISDEKGAS